MAKGFIVKKTRIQEMEMVFFKSSIKKPAGLGEEENELFRMYTLFLREHSNYRETYRHDYDYDDDPVYNNLIPSDHSGILSNNWSATSSASICSWIGVSCYLNNQTVTALNLSGMGLAGTFPPVIGNLSFLTSLDIDYNNINDSVPKELSHLHDFQHFLLFNNSFTGMIPSSLGNLTKLKSLNLRFNQLTGSVPDVIFNISLLRVIDLSSNNLNGSHPVDVCSDYVPKLEQIYLPFNRFEGRIPSNLYKCKEL
ncbi:hypothetical protein LguiA_004741 [Lonicera macranthoides]